MLHHAAIIAIFAESKSIGGGSGSLDFFYNRIMIDKNDIISAVEDAIKGTSLFLVGVDVTSDNVVSVEIDAIAGSVSIDDCVEISHAIEKSVDRDKEDYELEVGSAGLTSPFKVKAQYEKNVGNEVEVLTNSGEKHKGVLSEVTDDGFTITEQKKVKPEGSKRPVMTEVSVTFKFSETKQTKYLIQFK